MNAQFLLVLGALLAAPLTHAHTDGTPSGLPKTYCEDVKEDQHTHDYGPPATGLWLGPGYDASLPPCPYDPQWDGHYEWAAGGAWLLACESDCVTPSEYCDSGRKPDCLGAGSLVCWETDSDHAPWPLVSVFDQALTSAGLPVAFRVMADYYDNLPSDPTAPNCGDFELDYGQECVNWCQVRFAPGKDGSYAVCVEGSTGHVVDLSAGGFLQPSLSVAPAQDGPSVMVNGGPRPGALCGAVGS